MKRGADPSSGTRPAAPHDGGAVLRGVAVQHEPRTLRRPGAKVVSPAARVDPQRSGPERRERHVDPTGDRARAADAPADAAAAREQGYRAGLAEAESTRAAAEEAARERGYDAGFAKGREDGLAQGRDAGQRAVEQEARAAMDAATSRLATLDQLLSGIARERDARLVTAEDDLVAVAHAAVCRILGDALVTRDGVAHAIRQAVRESGAATGPQGAGAVVAIRVHPRDLAALRADERVAAWIEHTAGSVQWVADDAVGPGGCIVSSADGTLDARLETQMASLRALLRADPGSAPPATAASDVQAGHDGAPREAAA